MSLYQTYNNENILSRAVIAGLLDVLNNNITYEQVWANDDKENIDIPWFYNMSGDERFLQDFYTFYAHCEFPRPVDGNYDQIPRGIISYTGSNIDSQRITNRFVMGRYLKEVDGQLNSFVSFLYSIPLTIPFECELWLDTHITALKVEQAIREAFYKTKTFYVYFKGMRVGCTAGFPESIILEKNIKYSFEPDNKIKINFSLEVEIYQPVFDPTAEMAANSYMRRIGYRLYDKVKNDGNIWITSPDSSTRYPKGIPLWVEWNYDKESAVINRVDAYWVDSSVSNGSWTLLEKGILNNEFWIWNIPDNFTDFKQPAIIWHETDNLKIYRQPAIGVVPDISTLVIDANSFSVIEEGYFTSPVEDTSINITLEMKDSNGVVSYNDRCIFNW